MKLFDAALKSIESRVTQFATPAESFTMARHFGSLVTFENYPAVILFVERLIARHQEEFAIKVLQQTFTYSPEISHSAEFANLLSGPFGNYVLTVWDGK